MAQRPLVSDDLWEAIEPLLPRRAPQPKGGRPWVSDRAALGGIIFVLQTGLPWKRLPTELGTTSYVRVPQSSQLVSRPGNLADLNGQSARIQSRTMPNSSESSPCSYSS
jgi:transposase